ncbi:EAL domain-containing protein [Curvibacter sp. HBC28]|uniref:EAL domain-containing protein n=1 Tax=Curvibacter microcysteis TaxID=3026419 RepID=A0ABT5MI41_9BURK|nr:EAL domain-containing protein [Curvibacter sp. HBC28]MDD0816252.1 EAL domain-containing protein [Curvibacter sp. HBC28]
MKKSNPPRLTSSRSPTLVSGEAAPWAHDAALEEAAGFGLWQYDVPSGRLSLSAMAARYLDVPEGPAKSLDEQLVHVVAGDLAQLLPCSKVLPSTPVQAELRVISETQGMRWLRWATLPLDPGTPGQLRGVVQDITELKHAQVRERLGFELTEFLIGSHSLGSAILSVIQLVCRNLGWEWGAYWALEPGSEGEPQLACHQFWHHPEHDMQAFTQASQALKMHPGEGLVGQVWQSGQGRWIDDMAGDPRFLRRASARENRLWSGYVFPVTYVTGDGSEHRPGVLEFFSSLSRQPDALLPKLATTIGALLAQTAQKLEQQATVLLLSQVDGLTGLTNRRHFYEVLGATCRHAEAQGQGFALMFIDLDRFKPINDAFGHDAGNTVLREFGHRLQQLAPVGAVAGRLGGDEFALLLPAAPSQHYAEVAELVRQAARRPMLHEGVELSLTASVGISLFPENGSTPPELLRSADAAMYRIKQNGRDGCDFFSEANPHALAEQQTHLMQRLQMAQDLHQALRRQELFLVYQPIFDLAHGGAHAIEALIRWRRPDGQLVPPDVFIALAEETHLIVQIGQWVVAQACRDLASLCAAGLPDLKVHVNMAAPEFTREALPQELTTLVQAHGLRPEQLSLELTESLLMKQPEQVMAVMARLRQRGFDISLDDFGKGHSALSLLKDLPISTLKIDRAFVRGLGQRDSERAILATIMDLGRHLGLQVITEGVETDTQLACVRGCGGQLIQGFLLSRPLPLDALRQRLLPDAAG